MKNQIQPPLLKLASVPKKSQAEASVFTAKMLRRLEATNRNIRWLRERGVPTLKVDLHAITPMVIVPEQAAALLRREAFLRELRCFVDNLGGTLFVDDCALTWRHSRIA